MPSEYTARFALLQVHHGEPLRRQDLHGMIGSLLGHGAQQLPVWSLGSWKIEGPILKLPVRFRDDALPAPLDAALAKTAHPLEVGRRNTLVPVPWDAPDTEFRFLQAGPQRTWHELAAEPPIEKCAIEILTPLNFGKKSAQFDMFKVLASLHRQWADDATRPDFSCIQRNSHIVLMERATPYRVLVEGSEVLGVHGWVVVRARTPDPALAQVTGSLLALAPFCGVGYATAYGLGQLRVHRSISWVMKDPRQAPQDFDARASNRPSTTARNGSARRPSPGSTATRGNRATRLDRSHSVTQPTRSAPGQVEEPHQPVVTRVNPTG